ncbi:MAG: glycosyltransferase family 4 protein [Gemmatimonadetes bacterium]|nr:glycosyltransferase family 4 protein [Gemmatimonadota bacterium]
MAEILQPVLALSISSALGGSERSLLDFATRARGLGIDLRVGVPHEGPLTDALTENDVSIVEIPELKPLLPLSQQPGKFSALNTIMALPRFAEAGRAIGRLASPATVLYSNSFKTHLATVWARDFPAVWHIREYPPDSTGAVWKFLARRFPRKVIVNSGAVGDSWQVERTRVLHNGIDLDRFRPRPPTGWIHEKLGIRTEDRIIGMPAVFAAWKGQLEVLSAFERISADFLDTHLVFVGGPIYDTVAEHAFGKELAGKVRAPKNQRVHHLEFQTDVHLVYPELCLSVHYSLRPEPFGRVIMESMACGVPVIAVKEGGPVEILGGERGAGSGERSDDRESGSGKREWEPGVGGWLCEPRNVDALRKLMCEVLTLSPDELGAVGAKGRQRAERHFSADSFASGVAEVLKSCSRS